ncbi:rRNA N-glycosidase [Hordeum vulgare]|nr:rRNA N-glycosidase [Hordeum vulgare]
MTQEEEVQLIQCLLEESKDTHDERQWVGLDTMLALSAGGDVAVPELEMMDVKEEMKEEVLEDQIVTVFHLGLVGQ